MTLADDLQAWLLEHKLLVGMALVGLYIGYDRDPQTTTLLLAGLATAVGIGYVPAKRIVEWLYAPAWKYLVDIDPTTDEVAVYRLSPEAWEQLTVRDGDLHPLQAKYEAYECETYNPETNIAEGTWRASATDLELVRERERIDEVREHLETRAQEGLSIRIKAGTIVRDAVDRIINDLLATKERLEIHSGERVEEAVEAAVGEFDLETRRTEDPGEVVVEGELDPDTTATNGTEDSAFEFGEARS